MKVGILSTVAWSTPPNHYGPWEQMASNLCEGLHRLGVEVTLFATGNSKTAGRLEYITHSGYEEDRAQDAKVIECLHISNFMARAHEFDILHNHFDFLPLTYKTLISKPMVTTIHGFSSQAIVKVYKKYNTENHYVAISESNKHGDLTYADVIYNGINIHNFPFNYKPDNYLLYYGRIHPDKGLEDAISIARAVGKKLIIAGIVQDQSYYERVLKPFINADIEFVGSVGGETRSQLLGNAECLLHPIYFDEPFGLSVAEAMMCGTPVIAYNRGSMPELIQNGKTGFLVNNISEAVNAVNKVTSIDRSYCSKYSTTKFSMETMVDRYMHLYNRILNK